MNYFWKQNKAFVIAVGAALLVALGWYAVIFAPLIKSSDALKRDRDQAESDLKARMAAGVATDDLLTRAERDLKRTTDLLDGLQVDLQATEKAPFKAPEGKGVPEYFANQHLDTWNKIVDLAQQARITVNQHESPFGKVEHPTNEAAHELLLRLQLVNQICTIAINSGVDRIDSVLPTPDISSSGPASEVMGDAVAKKGKFLNRLPVRVKMRGTSTSLFKVVHGLQKKGDFFAITSFSATKEEELSDMFSCEIEASALLIEPKGGMAEVKEQP